MAFVRHGVLVADTLTSIELPDRRFYHVEILNADGDARIFCNVTEGEPGPSNTPEVDGDDIEVLPATICSLEISVGEADLISVNLISDGTPAYSVRAE